MNRREEIIAARPWLQDWVARKNGGNIVVGGDLDGYLCGLLLTNFCGAKVVGVYNNRTLARQKDTPVNVFVDFDIAHPNVVSIGHHITSYSPTLHVSGYNPQGVQINDLFGKTFKNKDSRSGFAFKFPFSTIILLMWLFGQDLQVIQEWKRFLLLQADGVFNNISNYPHSVKEWQGYFGWQQLGNMDVDTGGQYAIRYRELRADTVLNESRGQGKGTEKLKDIIVDPDGTCNFTTKIPFLKALGNELQLPYREDMWLCGTGVDGFAFAPRTATLSSIRKFNAISSQPNLLSMSFLNSAGESNYTLGDETTIIEAFGTSNRVAMAA